MDRRTFRCGTAVRVARRMEPAGTAMEGPDACPVERRMVASADAKHPGILSPGPVKITGHGDAHDDNARPSLRRGAYRRGAGGFLPIRPDRVMRAMPATCLQATCHEHEVSWNPCAKRRCVIRGVGLRRTWHRHADARPCIDRNSIRRRPYCRLACAKHHDLLTHGLIVTQPPPRRTPRSLRTFATGPACRPTSILPPIPTRACRGSPVCVGT